MLEQEAKKKANEKALFPKHIQEIHKKHRKNDVYFPNPGLGIDPNSGMNTDDEIDDEEEGKKEQVGARNVGQVKSFPKLRVGHVAKSERFRKKEILEERERMETYEMELNVSQDTLIDKKPKEKRRKKKKRH